MPMVLIMSACQPAVSGNQESSINLEQERTSIAVCLTATSPPPEPETPESATTTAEMEESNMGCQDTQGRIIAEEMVTEYLPNPLKYRIYLPPCYSDQTPMRYPLLIMLHGQSFNDDQWDRLGLDEAADEMISSGEAAPFIAVMPWEEYQLQAPQDSGFGLAIVNSLIPSIDQRLATCSDRNCRVVGGISRGAAWAMRLGLTDWQVFGGIGAHSFPPFGGDVYELPYWVQTIPADQRPRIYIDIGASDQFFEPAAGFEQQLTQLRIPHVWNIFPGTHEEAYWQSHIGDYLRWYVQSWKGLSESSE
jgi:enterochelin esterase-like enzyme